MDYPLRLAEQLKPHLRALRKSRGLTQEQLGALVGVKQARIAEIEDQPGAVSLDQLVKILAALGATLHLQAVEAYAAPATAAPPKAAEPDARKPWGGKAPTVLTGPRIQAGTSKKATPARVGVVIRANKGSW